MQNVARGLSKSNPVCLEHWAHNYLFVLSVGNFENFGLRISFLGFTGFLSKTYWVLLLNLRICKRYPFSDSYASYTPLRFLVRYLVYRTKTSD